MNMDFENVLNWYKKSRTPTITAEKAIELYFQFHPRTAFVKMLPQNSTLVDIGAGDGSLSIFRNWPDPVRRDIQMYAYSIEKGSRFDDFEAYELSDWNAQPPQFGGRTFDAILSAHFIEHIESPTSFLDWSVKKLNAGGRLYLEWPSVASNEPSIPSKSDLMEEGVNLVISRFDDDCTHKALPDRNLIKSHATTLGLRLVAEGVARLPWLEDELMANFRDAEDRFPAQAAFWSWSGWSQYLIYET